MRIIFIKSKIMKFIVKLFLCYLCFLPFGLNAFAICEDTKMVILGADCSKNIQSGEVLSVDPNDSDFLKKVENGECEGIIYDDQPMSECDAQRIVLADSAGSYFIQGNEFNNLDGYYNPGVLDTIVSQAEPGNNPFSIPWNWILKLSGFADEEVYEKIYDKDDLPFCDPNNLSNDYNLYSEIT